MDGSIRINHYDNIPTIARAQQSSEGDKRKPFDPEATTFNEDPRSDDEAQTHHDSVPVGHKPDDESGSHLDLTA